MCRLLGYVGTPIVLEKLLCEPPHSLIVQSYQPQEMTSGLLNADGFGIGWYGAERSQPPFSYRQILPIWSDINLPHLARYVESPCVLSYVRSATPGLAVDLSNCQPFIQDQWMFIHNGFIRDFRQTLYRPLRSLLGDRAYNQIQGTTDSEHLFALILDRFHRQPQGTLGQALVAAIAQLEQLAQTQTVAFSANVVISDGETLVACRYAHGQSQPSLYWLKTPSGVLVVSEPIFPGDWQSFAENSVLSVGTDLDLHFSPIPGLVPS